MNHPYKVGSLVQILNENKKTIGIVFKLYHVMVYDDHNVYWYYIRCAQSVKVRKQDELRFIQELL